MSADDFVKCLADSGLVAPGEVAKLRERLVNDVSVREAETLASALVKENLLTQYQAKVLLTGDSGGLVLGNYTVLDKIGQGGMGRVYKAWHRRMKRVVALKTLPPELTQNARAIERFRREVETAAKLIHRNIVTAFDADEVSGIHFLIMEYVEGCNLATLVRTYGPMTVVDAIRCLIDAAHGLFYAHQQGIIHRDIKPANLLLDSKGMVKVLDMGLARVQDFADAAATEALAELTSEQTVVGTADYLAPEQAMHPKRADHRVDIYSLGISFYYLLTGTIPYRGDTALERLIAHREQPIPSLIDVRADVPGEVDAICRRMMAKDPEHRYASMGQVIRALEDCLHKIAPDLPEGAPIRYQSPHSFSALSSSAAMTETMPMPAEGTHLRGIAWAGAILSMAAVVGVPLYLWKSRPPAPESPLSPSAVSQRLLSQQPVTPPSDGTSQTVAASVEEDRLAILAREFPGAPQFEKVWFDAAEAERRQQAWAQYLHMPVETTSQTGVPLVLIPPGKSLMGSSKEEVERLLEEAKKLNFAQWYIDEVNHEAPQRPTQVVLPLLAGKYEVASSVYRSIMSNAPAAAAASGESTSNPANSTALTSSPAMPIDSVNWYDAVEFCNRLSEKESLEPYYRQAGSSVTRIPDNGYRLPTEAEWEYICRAGTSTRWSFGDDVMEFTEYGYCHQVETAQASGRLAPNPWRIHDMHGNLWEWCDESKGEQRATRGGSFSWPAQYCRSASRSQYVPSYGKTAHGFRVVREVRSPRDVQSLGK